MDDYEKWLNIYLDENGIDLNDSFEIEVNGITHFFTYEVVKQAILNATHGEQQNVRKKIIAIDFKNGDIKHFFRYLAKALAESY